LSGFGRIFLFGTILATVVGIVGLRAQSQLGDPKDAPKIFASTCSACHKSPQGLAKSGQVAGFLRQHYTTGPEMSAAMAAYLVAAGAAPAKKEKSAAATAADPKTKGKKAEKGDQASTQAQTPAERAAEAKERRASLRGKQLQRQAKGHEEAQPAHPQAVAAPAPAHTPTVVAPAQPVVEPPTRQAAVPATIAEPRATPAAPEAGPPPVVFNIPLPEMPTAPPADLTQSSVFSSAPLP